MPTPFDNWTLDDAKKAVKILEWVKTNRAFYEGDHWQKGLGWIGPMPQAGETAYSLAFSELQKSFTSQNVIAEVVERHVMGLVGREIAWSLTPREELADGEEIPAELQGKIDEAEAFLTEWWDDRNVQEQLQRAVAVLLYSQRSPLSLYVPPGLLDSNGQVPRGSVADSLMRIFLRVPLVEQSTVLADPDTRARVGVYTYKAAGEQFAEIVYVDGEDTILRVLRKSTAATGVAPADGQKPGQRENEFRLKLGKRIPIHEMTRQLLVTEQVRQQQMALNLASSMIPRNVVTGGFLEQVLFNAQLPGKMEVDAEGNETGRFLAEPIDRGPGTVNNFVGVEQFDEKGELRGYATPSVHWREPVTTEASESAVEAHYRAILRECDQVHALIAGDATSSGVARQQARAAFIASLRRTAPQAAAAVRWLLETALAMAEAFAGTPGEYTKLLRVSAECKLDGGPVTAEEQNTNAALGDKGYLSRPGVLLANGVEDVDAEIARLDAEDAATLEVVKARAGVLTELVAAGAGIEGAALVAGFSEEEAQKLAMVDLPGDTQ